MKTLLRYFFRLLYHQFAFTYDLVAAAVSFNRWQGWVLQVIPFVEGTLILEIGHGPGHLQRALLSDPCRMVVGIDESAQMGRLAKRNLRRFLHSKHKPPVPDIEHRDYAHIKLTRGIAQHLPFPDDSFDTIVATFPTEYITDPLTLAEVKRCLRKSGRLIAMPVALPRNPLLDWLFKVTHQRPSEALEVIQTRLKEPFVTAGFVTEVEILDVRSGILLIIKASI